MAITEIESAFKLRGPLEQFWNCWDREQLLEGPAGTGKTTGALLRMLHLCEEYPTIRVLLTRKKRVDMSESVLKSWEEDILPHGHPCMVGPERTHRRHYEFPNGSRIVVKGLDDTESTKSAEYDLVYCVEATQLTVEDYEMLHRCLRSYRMPHQMIWMDANPSHPGHWINTRADGVKMRRWITRHRHNPRYWNGNDWTVEGRDYVQGTLANLTGVRRARLYEGKWVGSEGVIYDRWDRNVHVRAGVGGSAVRTVLAVDEGYTNPFVCLRLSVDGDGRLHVERERYQRAMNPEAKVRAVVEMGGVEAEAVLVDPSAPALIAQMREAGCHAVPANNDVFEGIMKVQQRLTVAGDGRPRLTVDPGCDNLVREFETYEWKPNRATGQTKDEPIKAHDHALDALRYGVAYLDKGAIPSVSVGAPTPLNPDPINRPMDWPDKRELPYGSPHRGWNRAPKVRY